MTAPAAEAAPAAKLTCRAYLDNEKSHLFKEGVRQLSQKVYSLIRKQISFLRFKVS